jgi:hypothetical protein
MLTLMDKEPKPWTELTYDEKKARIEPLRKQLVEYFTLKMFTKPKILKM